MEVHELRTNEEAHDAYRVNVRAWREAYADILPDDALPATNAADRGTAREWHQRVSEGESTVLVAAEAGSVVGFLELCWGDAANPFVREDEVEIRALYVDPDRWGEGVASTLLDAAPEAVPDRFEGAALQTFVANERGRGFYESRGFERREGSEFVVDGGRYPTVVYARTLEEE